MAAGECQIVIDVPPDRVFDVICDYERYPEFLPWITEARVLSRENNVVRVHFELELVMRVAYTLEITEQRSSHVEWKLEDARLILLNNGHWDLKPRDDGGTDVTYGLEVVFPGTVPQSVSGRLLNSTLPDTLERFKGRAESGL